MTRKRSTPPRNPEETRALLLAAGAAVLDRHYVSHVGRPPLPVTVTEILDETPQVAESLGMEPRRVTTGAVADLFGGKTGLLAAVAAEYISAERLAAGLNEGLEELRNDQQALPKALRLRLAEADLRNMAEAPSPTRHWFLAHAHAANPEVAKQLTGVYRSFDELLGDFYQWLGEQEGVEPKPPLTWREVATAMTAWAEGQALRYLGDSDASSFPWLETTPGQPGLTALGADALWSGLTQPVASADPDKG